MSVAAIVLAAGASSRLPGNKLLQPFRGKPLIRHAVDAALASGADPVLIVTGNDAAEITSALRGLRVRIVENTDYSVGLSESLKCGVRNVPEICDGALVLLGDMPFVTADLIDRLLASRGSNREICVPVCRGRRGNPVLWSRRFFPELMSLTGDRGAKPLMDLYRNVLYELEVEDEGVLIDIDTPDDLRTYGP